VRRTARGDAEAAGRESGLERRQASEPHLDDVAIRMPAASPTRTIKRMRIAHPGNFVVGK
jgi:hypothetical protein